MEITTSFLLDSAQHKQLFNKLELLLAIFHHKPTLQNKRWLKVGTQRSPKQGSRLELSGRGWEQQHLVPGCTEPGPPELPQGLSSG